MKGPTPRQTALRRVAGRRPSGRPGPSGCWVGGPTCLISCPTDPCARHSSARVRGASGPRVRPSWPPATCPGPPRRGPRRRVGTDTPLLFSSVRTTEVKLTCWTFGVSGVRWGPYRDPHLSTTHWNLVSVEKLWSHRNYHSTSKIVMFLFSERVSTHATECGH